MKTDTVVLMVGLACAIVLGVVAGPLAYRAGVEAGRTLVAPPPPAAVIGLASYVAPSLAGNVAKSGEVWSPHTYTAAVKKNRYIAGQWLRVKRTDASPATVVYVRVNDLLPETARTDIDLSPAAFRLLAPLEAGVVPVSITVVH